MPRTIPQTELDAICQTVAHFPNGASVEELGGELKTALPRRTMQRRLALLVEQGRLVSEGAGRGCRYRLPASNVNNATSNRAVSKAEVLAILARLKPLMAQRFGVIRLSLFGSTVRDEAKPDSDIDIVVEFDGPATSSRYFGVQFFLEDELGRPVDLVSKKALRAELRSYIEQEAIHV